MQDSSFCSLCLKAKQGTEIAAMITTNGFEMLAPGMKKAQQKSLSFNMYMG